MKKILISILLIVVSFCILQNLFSNNIVNASENENATQTLIETVDKSLDELDLSEIEEIVSGLDNENSFTGTSFYEKLKSVLSGEQRQEYDSTLTYITNIFFEDMLAFIPILCAIIAIVIMASFISSLRSNVAGMSTNNVVHFACFSVVLLLVSACVMSAVQTTTTAITSLQGQMNAVFPIMLTLLTAVGGVTSAAIYQPAVAILINGIMQIFTMILLPLFITSFVFNVVGNLSTSVKLDKFNSFISSVTKWLIGLSFTIFFAFLTIQGISASTYDTISVKAAKFAVSSYVPILGGYLSQGFDMLLASGVLIKNAFGTVALILLVSTVLAPVVKIGVLMLMLKLTCAVLEPIADSRICNFLHSTSKSLSYLIVAIVGVSFMYFLTVGLIMSTANTIL